MSAAWLSKRARAARVKIPNERRFAPPNRAGAEERQMKIQAVSLSSGSFPLLVPASERHRVTSRKKEGKEETQQSRSIPRENKNEMRWDALVRSGGRASLGQ